MKLTPKIHQAMSMVAIKFHGQKRKENGSPYIIHPFAVAFILNDYTNDEDVICAGLLHSLMENVNRYGYVNLEKDFGWRISCIIREIAEDKDEDVSRNSKLTWEKRKKKYLKLLEKASQEALLVSASDKLHNLITMVEFYGEKKDKMWVELNASSEKTLWFYREYFNIISRLLQNKIVKDIERVYSGLESIITGDSEILKSKKANEM